MAPGIEGAAYDGHNLVEYGDVVFVSVNARLNLLGYLDLSACGEEYKNTGISRYDGQRSGIGMGT